MKHTKNLRLHGKIIMKLNMLISPHLELKERSPNTIVKPLSTTNVEINILYTKSNLQPKR